MNSLDARATVQANINRGANPLDGLLAPSTPIFAALEAVMQFGAIAPEHTQIELRDPNQLDIRIDAVSPWMLEGQVSGVLEQVTLCLTLEFSEQVRSSLSLDGLLSVQGMAEQTPVGGVIDGEYVWVLELTGEYSGNAPTSDILDRLEAQELAEWCGVSDIVIDRVIFGLHLGAFKWSMIGIGGQLTFLGVPLWVEICLDPHPTITGAMLDGERVELRPMLEAMGLPIAWLPAGDVCDLAFEADYGYRSMQLEFGLALPWELQAVGKSLSLTEVEFRAAFDECWELELGAHWLVDGIPLIASARLHPSSPTVVLWLRLPPGVSVSSSALLSALLPVGLPSGLPELELSHGHIGVDTGDSSIQLGFASPTTWSLPLGLSLGDLHLEFAYAAQSGLSGRVAGTLALAGASFEADYAFPGDLALAGHIESLSLSPLLQALCGTEALLGLPIPANALTLELRDLDFRLAVEPGEAALAGTVDGFGRGELATRGSQFSLAIALDHGWSPSQLHAALAPLDGLSLSNTKLALATGTNAPPPASIAIPGGVPSRGLSLYTTVDLTGLGLDLILGRTTLDLRAAIASDPSQTSLEAALAGEVMLAEGLVMTRSVIRLRLDGPSLAIVGTAAITLSGTTLDFEGALEVEPRAASLVASLVGTWTNPFGFEGIELTNVALELGLSYPPLVPKVGIAAELRVGTMTGAVAVAFDASQPTKCMLVVEFDQLSMLDMLDSFGGSAISGLLPSPLRSLLASISWSEVEVYVVPQSTMIGAIHYPAGFRMQGRLTVLGASAFARVEIQRGSRILAQGEVDVVSIAGLFSLTGTDGIGKAAMLLDLEVGKSPRFELSGAVELLGMRADANIVLSGGGFSFSASGKLFDAFSASIQATGSSLGSAAGFSVSVTMQADLLGWVAEQAIAMIKDIAGAAIQQIDAAQGDIEAAKGELSRLDTDIAKARAVVEAERDKLAADLASLRAQVSAAQGEVNKIQSDINAKHARIRTLNREIAAKNDWLARRPWWEVPWATAVTAAYVAPRLAEISALYAQIAVLEAARIAALAVLEGLKLSLSILEFTVANLVPIEADPRVAGLIALRVTADAILTAAIVALEVLEASVGAVAAVGTAVLQAGASALVVHSAGFSCALAAASGGSVSMSFDLSFLGQRISMALPFSFHNPTSSLHALVGELLP